MSKDGSGTQQIVSSDVAGTERKSEKVDDRLGTFVLPRQVEVVGAPVDFIYFYKMRAAGVFVQYKARRILGAALTSDACPLPRV